MRRPRLRPILTFLGITTVLLLLGLELLGQIFLPGPFVLEMADETDRETYQRAAEQMYVSVRPNGTVPEELDWHDPDLGWDRPEQPEHARPTPGEAPADAAFPIVAIGDSYTYGAEVEDGETWPYQLETRLGDARVLNLGVEGYGLEQALLKYRKYGREHRPRVIVMGVALEQFVRTGLPFFYFNAKPMYRREGETAVLTGVPIAKPPETYATLAAKHPDPGSWYLATAARQIAALLTRDPEVARARREAYFDDMRVVIGHILDELLREAEATGAEVVVLHIPRKQRFNGADGVASAREHPMRRLLFELYEEKGIPVVDLLEEFAARHEPEAVKQRLYTEGVDGIWGSGHLSPEGNALAAELVAARIGALGLR